jgi:hypothetical protein
MEEVFFRICCLFIINSSYRFEETSKAKRFATRVETFDETCFGPVTGPAMPPQGPNHSQGHQD